MVEVRRLARDDEELLASCAAGVFDHPIDEGATRAFLADSRHHLVVAIAGETVVGFASAVHYLHPDKARPEMWINEIGVAPSHRGQGIGKRLLRELLEVAQEHGCAEAWTLTERANSAAMQLYRSLGGVEAQQQQVMFTFVGRDEAH